MTFYSSQMVTRIGYLMLLLGCFTSAQAFAALTGNTSIVNQADVNYQSTDGTVMDTVSSQVSIEVTPVHSYVYANFDVNRVISSNGTVPTSDPVSFDFVNTGNVSEQLTINGVTQFGTGNLASESLDANVCEGDGTANNSGPDGQDLTCIAVPGTLNIWASGVESVASPGTTPVLTIYSDNDTGTADPTANNNTGFVAGDLVSVEGVNCTVTAVGENSPALDTLTLACDSAITGSAPLVGERKQFQITGSATLATTGAVTQQNTFFQASITSPNEGAPVEYCTGADVAPCSTDNTDTDDFDLATDMTIAVVGPSLEIVKYQYAGGVGTPDAGCETESYNSLTFYGDEDLVDPCFITDVPSTTVMTYLIKLTNASGLTYADPITPPAACFNDGAPNDNSGDVDCAGNAAEVIVTDDISPFLTLDSTSVILDLNCDGDGADGSGEADSNATETLVDGTGKLNFGSPTLTVYADGPGNDDGDESGTPVGGTITPSTTTCVSFQATVI